MLREEMVSGRGFPCPLPGLRADGGGLVSWPRSRRRAAHRAVQRRPCQPSPVGSNIHRGSIRPREVTVLLMRSEGRTRRDPRHCREIRLPISPSSTRNQAYASFEAAVAEWFAGWVVLDVERPGITAETTRRDWWSYLTLVVLPDVACWRWVSETQGNLLKHERFLGGGRNTFQRIHRRVLCLDRGTDHPDRFGLIRELKEDDFSAILERPSLSSSPRIARMIAEELLLMRARLSEAGWGLGQQQSVYRQAIKALCAYGIVTVFDLLDDAQLQDVVRESFLQCEMKLKRDVPHPDNPEDQGKTNRLIGAVRYLFSGSIESAVDGGSDSPQ